MANRSFAPFRHRAFRLRWFGAFVSNIGTWMETVALGYYVADTTGQSTWAALVAAGGFLPLALLSPVGGVLADRLSRRLVMVMTSAVQLVIALTLAVGVAQEWASPPVIALLALAAGSMNAIGFPAFQASVPELVPDDEIVAASGLFAMQWNLGRILGPAAAAFVIWLGGVPWALGVNAISFVAVIVAVSIVGDAPRDKPPRRSMLASIREGFRFGWNEPGLRGMYTIQIATAFLAAPFIAFVPMFATDIFDGDELTTGLLVTCQGIGAVMAGTLMGSVNHRFGIRRVLLGSAGLLGPALVVYGMAPTLPIAMLGLFVVGSLYLAMFTTFSAVTQTRAPASLRGRLMSVNNMLLGLLYPVGALLQGVLADSIGLRWVTAGSGVILLAVLLVGRVVLPGITAPLDEPPTPVPTPDARLAV
jgi:MFS family permease